MHGNFPQASKERRARRSYQRLVAYGVVSQVDVPNDSLMKHAQRIATTRVAALAYIRGANRFDDGASISASNTYEARTGKKIPEKE
jgi:hypothetical protein